MQPRASDLTDPDVQGRYDIPLPPLLVVISGTSGSGKDTVVKALIRHFEAAQHPVHFVVTATTRPRRETEVDGVDYVFVSKAEFVAMIANDALVEYALVYGDYKGVPKEHVYQAMEAMTRGQDVIMRLDVQGAETIRQLVPEALLVFITTPSEGELIERLQERRTEDQEQLEIRLRTARQEMSRIPEFDYVVANADGKLDDTVNAVLAIMTAEKHRTHPRRADLRAAHL
jgi:guanylate kinase